ncbi:MAG: amidase family protein [Oscillospiraceae bacterium]|nr:amidase family protein [Oscillospiraceae bacterium]
MMTSKPVFLEDSILRKGLPATAGSKILQGFKAPFDAAVAERLTGAGYALRSEPPGTEFGIAPPAPVPSPVVTAVAEGRADLALCNDFSGAAGDQAAALGLYTIRPTYGTVSRYGLIPSVCSMDAVSVVCRDLRQGFALLEVIAGHDERDGVSEPEPSYRYAPSEEPLKTAAVSRETLPMADAGPAVMDILVCAELSGNLSRYDGLRFGYRSPDFKGLEELYLKTRTEGFSPETKLSLVVGAMVLSEGWYEKRYHKAMQIRRMLRDGIDALLMKYDVLSAPAWAAPLCGLPSVTLPGAAPPAARLVAARKRENALYAAAERGGIYGV